MQIRTKLTLQFILIVATIMLVAFYYIHNRFRDQLQDDFYESLRSKAFLTGEMLVGKIKDRNEEFFQARPGNEHNPISSENIAIYNSENELIYSFSEAKTRLNGEKLNQVRNDKEKRFIYDKFNSIGVLYRNKFGFEYIIIAESVFNSSQLSNLARILMWVYILFISLVALGGWIFAGQALRPVNSIMNEVDAILPSDMTHRLNHSGQKDELSRLVQTFNKLLERMQQVFVNQKQFLSNISHELKNPLNVILSQIEVALTKERPAEEYRNVLQSVYEDVIELNDVSSKIMQLSKINSDGSSIRFENFRLDEVLFQAKTSVQKMNASYKISLVMSDLPENENELNFYGNEQLIKTALINIMENAAKYSSNQEVVTSLKFSPQLGAVLCISDKGIGMEKREVDLIFEPFYRSQNAKVIRGSGIGLSLVKSIFALHNIRYDVQSEKGKGTLFYIYFASGNVKSVDSVQKEIQVNEKV
ncbi:MAG: HAMP domain-containing histidine kinase [Saprospiraceae bacterium]|nr:HAMP domain-containing histidine kinase [Saprospiraceae bacterium]